MWLIAFPDSGFVALYGSHSGEGAMVVLVQALGRDRNISRRGNTIDRRCAEFIEVAKALWAPMQILLYRELIRHYG